MRARILAVIILVVLLGGPVFLYWYFTERQISSIEFSLPEGQVAKIVLSGTFSSRWLPLADKLLRYEKDCTSVCEFGPIPPVQYRVEITPLGRPDISQTDTVDLLSGQRLARRYDFAPQVEFVPRSYSGDIIQAKEQVIRLKLQTDESIEFLGMSMDGKIYARTRTSLGQVVDGKYRILIQLAPDITSVILDKTGEFFVLTYRNQTTRIVRRDLSMERDIATAGVYAVAPLSDDAFKILADSGVLFSEGGKLKENIRFTDFIDISPAIRIGYIDGSDTKKLNLSNLPSDSTWMFLSRANGEVHLFRKGVSNAFLYSSGSEIYSIRDDGTLWEIRIPR